MAKVKIKKALKKNKSKSKNSQGVDQRTFYDPNGFKLDQIKEAGIAAQQACGYIKPDVSKQQREQLKQYFTENRSKSSLEQ